jgi:membrane protein implicated in regulation of membrane protease activity
MCHLIFLLPIFGLPVFWFFFFKTALISYLIICAISLFLYYKIFQAMHSRVRTGRESMLGKTAVVISGFSYGLRLIVKEAPGKSN